MPALKELLGSGEQYKHAVQAIKNYGAGAEVEKSLLQELAKKLFLKDKWMWSDTNLGNIMINIVDPPTVSVPNPNHGRPMSNGDPDSRKEIPAVDPAFAKGIAKLAAGALSKHHPNVKAMDDQLLITIPDSDKAEFLGNYFKDKDEASKTLFFKDEDGDGKKEEGGKPPSKREVARTR